MPLWSAIFRRTLSACLLDGIVVRPLCHNGSRFRNSVPLWYARFSNEEVMGKLDRIPADKAVEMIDSAVSHFNTKRILLKLGGLTPQEYLLEYVREHKCGLKVAVNT